MIVEFTGPTGAGKSTYLAHLVDHLASQGVAIGVIGHQPNHMDGIPDTFAILETQDWKTDIAALPWACLLMIEYPRYACFALRTLIGLSAHRLAICRAVIRKMGIYRFLSRRRFRDKIVLVDEGIVHVGHNILVAPADQATDSALRKFAELSPVPTFAVILTAPHKVLVSRLRERGDLSPRIRSDADLYNFTRIAVRFFEIIAPGLLKRTGGLHFDTTQTGSADVATMVSNAIRGMSPVKAAAGEKLARANQAPGQPTDRMID